MAGTVTQVFAVKGKNEYLLTYSWIGDAINGGVPDTDSVIPIDGYVYMVVTNPGTTPTASYGITLKDDEGVDIMGGELASRSNANTEQAVPKIDATLMQQGRRVNGLLTLGISSQTAVGATGDVLVYIRRP